MKYESINSLLTEITGIENIKGEIVYKDNQKFVKLNLKSNRGENEYILTQFLTVTNKTMYTLSFYTAIDEDIDYIENTFSVSKEKININLNKDYSSIKIIVICATVIFAAACLILLYTIIRDLIVSKKNFPLDNKDNMNLPE